VQRPLPLFEIKRESTIGNGMLPVPLPGTRSRELS